MTQWGLQDRDLPHCRAGHWGRWHPPRFPQAPPAPWQLLAALPMLGGQRAAREGRVPGGADVADHHPV